LTDNSTGCREAEEVGYVETLDELSDLMTDGVSVAFMRFLPHDIAAASALPPAPSAPPPAPGASHTRDAAPDSEEVAVGEELREALQLPAHDGGSGGAGEAVVIAAVAGMGAGWNCSCRDTRHGWAFIERLVRCCNPPPAAAFGLSQAAQQLSLAGQHAARHARAPEAVPPAWRQVGGAPGRGQEDQERGTRRRRVFAAEALERVAAIDLDRLVRFLSMLRLRRPRVLVTSADVPPHVAHLLAGTDCRVLSAPRHALLQRATLARLEHDVLDALAAGEGAADQDAPAAQVGSECGK